MVFIPGVYQGCIPHSRSADVDEERRLLYVAMTRAQGLLYLSFPSKNGNDGKRLSSRILKEEKQNLSDFVQEPKVGRLLAKRGSAIDVKGIASILNREEPRRSEIERACANMYFDCLNMLTQDLPYMTKIGLKVNMEITLMLRQGSRTGHRDRRLTTRILDHNGSVQS